MNNTINYFNISQNNHMINPMIPNNNISQSNQMMNPMMSNNIIMSENNRMMNSMTLNNDMLLNNNQMINSMIPNNNNISQNNNPMMSNNNQMMMNMMNNNEMGMINGNENDDELIGLTKKENLENLEREKEGKIKIKPYGCGRSLNWKDMEDCSDEVISKLKEIAIDDYHAGILNISEQIIK